MTKTCPECGKELLDEAHFCVDCGYDFFKEDSSQPAVLKSDNDSNNIFTNGKIFLVLIAVVVIVGAAVILSFGMGGNATTGSPDDGIEHVYLTINDVTGYSGNSDGKTYYSLWTNVLFTGVPSNQKGYLIKTVYFDENDTQIGQETETLSNAYYDTDYEIMIGYFTTYKKPNLDHVNVEIIYNNKTVDTYTHEVNKDGISFLS